MSADMIRYAGKLVQTDVDPSKYSRLDEQAIADAIVRDYLLAAKANVKANLEGADLYKDKL